MNTRARSRDTEYFERLGGLETRMDHVENTLSAHGSKLDAVLNAVSGHTKFDPIRILTFISLAVLIFGGVAGGIIYISTAVNQASALKTVERLGVLEFQTQKIWQSGRWVPIVYQSSSTAPGSVHVKSAQ